MNRKVMWTLVVLFFIPSGGVQAQLLSDFFNDLKTNLADDVGLPTDMFTPSGSNPFSDVEITDSSNPFAPVGATTVAVWDQTIDLQHFNGIEVLSGVVGPNTNVPVTIQMSGIESQFKFYEPTDGVFVDSSGADPIKNSSMNMAQINMNLIDADGDAGNGFTPFTNDMPFPQIPVAPNTPIAVWQGEPIAVEIVALTLTGLEPIAVNQFTPLGIFGDDGVNLLDSSFGIFTGDWSLPLTENVLIDESGTGAGPFIMSPFLKAWKPKFQILWKTHRRGLVAVGVGPQIPGPAGILHPVGGGVPEPSTMILALLGLVGLFVQGRRRRRG